MEIPSIYDSVQKAAIIERVEIDRFANEVQVISGCTHDEANEFVTKIPPAQRGIAKTMIYAGMTIEQSVKILSDTVLFACWNSGMGLRDSVKKFVSDPTISNKT